MTTWSGKGGQYSLVNPVYNSGGINIAEFTDFVGGIIRLRHALPILLRVIVVILLLLLVTIITLNVFTSIRKT